MSREPLLSKYFSLRVDFRGENHAHCLDYREFICLICCLAFPESICSLKSTRSRSHAKFAYLFSPSQSADLASRPTTENLPDLSTFTDPICSEPSALDCNGITGRPADGQQRKVAEKNSIAITSRDEVPKKDEEKRSKGMCKVALSSCCCLFAIRCSPLSHFILSGSHTKAGKRLPSKAP